jgi:NTP pyrophosphatase (non-canonical NTP hydrolase)
VVLCGTFHRDLEGLAHDYHALTSIGCDVLSPRDINFVAEVDGFALAAHEVDDEPRAVEQRHLEALQQADFVWLHAPEGYVGASATLELGVAYAYGIQVFARERPGDPMLGTFVQVVDDVHTASQVVAESGLMVPARPLDALQTYYDRIAHERGYASESLQDSMLLLTEEVGELARAVRKRVGLARSSSNAAGDLEAELADVQLYLLHLANLCEVSLANAVLEKERLNAGRFEARQRIQAA